MSKKDKEKKKSGRTFATGFTLLVIPNSSEETKTREISYDTVVKYFAAFIAVLIIVAGLIASMMVHNRRLKESLSFQEECVKQLSETNEDLNAKIDALNRQIATDREAFSKIEDTISKREEEETRAKEEAAIPTLLPIKGANALAVADPFASNPQSRSYGIVFSTLGGALIVTTGDGIVGDVKKIDTDEGYNCFVLVNHQNGYITYYRFMGDVSVKVGDTLLREDVIGVMTDDGYVSYEITKDGDFADPKDMIDQSEQTKKE